MATWQELSDEMIRGGQNGPDIVRRRKLTELHQITSRPIMLYAVEMFNRPKINIVQGDIAIDLSDKDGFITALRDISGDEIDLILHSPGGSPEATESLVTLLRRRFHQIRVIIPNVAKSAATMLAMSADEIIIGNDAELGPTDPQLVLNGRFCPAHAILAQFENAKKELKNNSAILPAWLPILQQYGPSLLSECKDAIKLSKRLVTNWLTEFMFAEDRNKKAKARRISTFLAEKTHLSHNRAINITKLKQMGLKISYAHEVSPDLSEIIQDISYSISLTFNMTGAYKMFENHLGKGLFKIIQVQTISLPQVATPRQN